MEWHMVDISRADIFGIIEYDFKYCNGLKKGKTNYWIR